MIRSIISIVFVLCFLSLRAQSYPDSIIFMNGEIRKVKVLDTLNNKVKFEYRNKKNNSKIIGADADDIFAVVFDKKTEVVFYIPDTLLGNVFNVNEARYFVLGEYEAHKNFHPKAGFIGGFIIGAASPILSPTVLAPLPMMAFSLAVRIPDIRIKTKKIINKSLLDQTPYILGYENVARNKKTIRALLGGTAGVAVGFAVKLLLLKEKVY